MSLLNEADALYIGAAAVDAVYVGAEKVWPAALGDFDPISLGGLAVWIDASQLVLADGAPVSPWPDLSGGNRHGSCVGTPPILKTNILNGKSVVRMTASGVGRYIWNGTTGVDAPCTLIYVARITDTRIDPSRVVSSIYPPMNFLFGFYGAQKDIGYAGAFFGTPAATIAGEWKMYSADSDAGGANIRFWSDGVSLPGLVGGGQTLNNTLILGGYDYNGTDAQQPDADYAELLLYNRQLSTADRVAVEGYLRAKWGL